AGELAAIHEVGVERIGHDVAVLLRGDGVPVAHRDLAVVAAAGDAHRAALLLAAAHAVRVRVVGGDVIELRGGLVVPLAPRAAAVDRDHGALIAAEHDDVGIDGIDPHVLVVVAAGRAAQSRPGLAAVDRSRADRGRDIHGIGVLGIDARHREIAAADARGGPRIIGDHGPGLAAVVGAVELDAGTGRHAGDQARRLRRGDGQVGLHDVGGKAAAQLRPGGATIARLVDAAASARPRAVLPRSFARLPECRVHDAWIRWIDDDVG